MDSYNYTYEHTANYCYKDSDVLINKLNIKDEKVLEETERKLVYIRQGELHKKPIIGNLDFEHLKNIHKFLFQDLYRWAGEVRNCNIAKQDLFCLTQNIEAYANDIFSNLKRKNYFIGFPEEMLIEALVDLFCDINALHPFREGNGRTQREFILKVARINGINICFHQISRKEMIEASHESINGRNQLMKNIFLDNLQHIPKEKQILYINKYLSPQLRDRIFKLFDA